VDLYYIRGFSHGEFDEAIPMEYFQIPTSEVFDTVPGISAALRVGLDIYSQAVASG